VTITSLDTAADTDAATSTEREHLGYYVGLDLGQTSDYTAFAIVAASREWGSNERRYAVQHLERPKLGTPYPAIVARTVQLCADSRLHGPAWAPQRPTLVIDQTGVGRPVVDMLTAASPAAELVAVSISGGAAVTRGERGAWCVPKRDLASILAILLQSRRLTVAKALPEAQTLVTELLNFKVKISAAGHDSYESWRENVHDDLVLATALACWWSERPRQWLWEIR
jgi:hypothetical protein